MTKYVVSREAQPVCCYVVPPVPPRLGSHSSLVFRNLKHTHTNVGNGFPLFLSSPHGYQWPCEDGVSLNGDATPPPQCFVTFYVYRNSRTR